MKVTFESNITEATSIDVVSESYETQKWHAGSEGLEGAT
jgi:hypothetical protein